MNMLFEDFFYITNNKQRILLEREDSKKLELCEKIYRTIKQLIKNEKIFQYMFKGKIEDINGKDVKTLNISLSEIFPKIFKNESGKEFKICFASNMLSNFRDSMAFYSPENNFIVFNSGKYSSFISIENNLLEIYNSIDRTAFIHELVHMLDDLKYNLFKNYENIDSIEEYANNTNEINSTVFELLKNGKRIINKCEDFTEFSNTLINNYYNNVERFETNPWKDLVTKENKKRIIKRLYDFWIKNRKK